MENFDGPCRGQPDRSRVQIAGHTRERGAYDFDEALRAALVCHGCLSLSVIEVTLARDTSAVNWEQAS